MRLRVSAFTWVGLFIALFGFLVLRFSSRAIGVPDTTAANLWREVVVWIMAALLIVLIRFGERLPLDSIRLGVAPWRQSLRYGCILAGV
ncbi:MAG TPA: hypothetical protein VG103_00055, partial [Chthoniobacterales bacterium]|nr:hypothetical protein [Chthoniobacterales bacterium]